MEIDDDAAHVIVIFPPPPSLFLTNALDRRRSSPRFRQVFFFFFPLLSRFDCVERVGQSSPDPRRPRQEHTRESALATTSLQTCRVRFLAARDPIIGQCSRGPGGANNVSFLVGEVAPLFFFSHNRFSHPSRISSLPFCSWLSGLAVFLFIPSLLPLPLPAALCSAFARCADAKSPGSH